MVQQRAETHAPSSANTRAHGHATLHPESVHAKTTRFRDSKNVRVQREPGAAQQAYNKTIKSQRPMYSHEAQQTKQMRTAWTQRRLLNGSCRLKPQNNDILIVIRRYENELINYYCKANFANARAPKENILSWTLTVYK